MLKNECKTRSSANLILTGTCLGPNPNPNVKFVKVGNNSHKPNKF